MKKFNKITTGNGYQNDLIATTNNRLEMTVEALENLDRTFQLNMFMLSEDVRDLTKITEKSNNENTKLQKLFLVLSGIGTVLATTQLIQVVDVIKRWIGH